MERKRFTQDKRKGEGTREREREAKHLYSEITIQTRNVSEEENAKETQTSYYKK